MSYYKSKQHKRWREIVLRQSEYRCQMCKRQGQNVPATDAHHIWPIETHPHLRLDPRNGIGLCAACHNAVEPRGRAYDPPAWMLRRCPVGETPPIHVMTSSPPRDRRGTIFPPLGPDFEVDA